MSSLANQLCERVTIEQPVASDDGYGGQEISWTTLATVFAEVVPMQLLTRERGLADQRKAIAGYKVRLRLRGDVDASMRFQWKGRVLQIYSLHLNGEAMEFLTYEEQV